MQREEAILAITNECCCCSNIGAVVWSFVPITTATPASISYCAPVVVVVYSSIAKRSACVCVSEASVIMHDVSQNHN